MTLYLIKSSGYISRVGGIIGSHIANRDSTSKILENIFSGEISVKSTNVSNVAGIVGSMTATGYNSYHNTPIEVLNNFSIGNLNSNQIDGGSGLIGYVYADETNSYILLENNFSISKAVGVNSNGGLVNNVEERDGGIIADVNNFWNQSVSFHLNSAVGNNLNTTQMLDSTNFTGFDFENTWDIIQGYSFPYLRDVGNHLASVHQITGNEGWRLISAPLDSITYGEMLDSLWTQGFTNADVENGTPNVYTRNEESGTWEAISDSADVPEPGEGILVYVYDDDDNDGTSDGFPKTLIMQGAQRTEDVSKSLPINLTGPDDSYDATNDGWNFVGNPFAYPINWDEVEGWTKTGIDNSIYIWNNSVSQYQSWNGFFGTLPSDGIIPPFQGFWVKGNNSEAPSITIGTESRTSGGALLKRKATPILTLNLKAKNETDSLFSQTIVALLPDATVDKDPYDAWKLTPLSEEYLSLFTTLEDSLALDINALPEDLANVYETNVGFDLSTNQSMQDFEFSWTVENFPDDWELVLVDHSDSTEVVLTETSSYSFSSKSKGRINTEVSKKTISELEPSVVSISNSKEKAVKNESVFSLRINPALTSTHIPDSDIPSTINLSQNYPNPFNPSTSIKYELPENSLVELAVFDMLGRKIATLVNDRKEAGYHEVNFDASQLASGVYIYQLQAGSKIFTQKMTLIK